VSVCQYSFLQQVMG